MSFAKISLELLKGFAVTCEIFFITLVFAIPLGIILMFAQKCKIKTIKVVIQTFIWVIRGTPLMLQVIAVYYGPAILFNVKMLPRLIAVLVAFIINYACYFSEIFRGGFDSISKGQYEAGAVLGLTKTQIFFKIILIQVIKRIIPPMSNEIITLVKDTSLARVIVVAEILKVAGDYTAKGLIWPLFYTAVYYLVFVGILTILFKCFEKKLDYFKVWFMAFLKVTKLRKSFGKNEVLKGIEFSLEKGKILAIIGPSGNGKTTLLRCLNFLEIPTGGAIELDGELIFDGNSKELKKSKLLDLRDKFGLVFQGYNLFPQYSVFQNVKLALELAEKRRKKENKPTLLELDSIEKEVYSVLKKLKLEEKSNSYPYELSGGEAQRVAIARALVLKPSVLCFDEPTAALDPNLTKEVTKLVKELKNKFNLTIIIVTHEMKFAKRVADEVMLIKNGVVAEYANAEKFFDSPQTDIAKEFLNGFDD